MADADWQCPACDRWFTRHDPEHELCVYCRGELAAAVAEIVTDAAGWRELPPGYVIPGIIGPDGQPIRPVCGHATPAGAAGYVADCDELATHARPFTDQSAEYACARHAGEDGTP